MRIAALLPADVSFPYDWASASALEHEVIGIRVARSSENRRPSPDFPVMDVVVGDWVQQLPARTRQRFVAQETVRVVKRLADAGRPVDVVHGHFYSQAVTLLALRQRALVPFVLTEHSSRLTGSSSADKPLTSRGLTLARRAYEEASEVIFVSRYLQGCAEERGLAPKASVIGNPVDPRFHALARFPSSPPEVLWVGRLEEDKDPLGAVEIAEGAARRVHGLTLHLAGDGPLRVAVRQVVRSRGLSDVVQLHGRLSRADLLSLMRRTTTFLTTSTVETFGLAVAEAAVAGIPVVAPRLPALLELLEAHGAFFPAGEAEAASEQIAAVSANPPATHELAERLWDRLAPTRVAEQLHSIYERAASEWAGRIPVP
jgi:glycosyltransferase involved in cell wall biosynthesis